MADPLETPFLADQLLPDSDPPPDPQEELNNFEALGNQPPALEDLIVQETEPEPVGQTWAFDFSLQRFVVPQNAHSPIAVRGLDAIKVWIETSMRTELGSGPAFAGTNFGLEDPFGGVGEGYASPALGGREGRVRAALTVHPRIADITDYAMQWDDDDEYVAETFRVVFDDGNELVYSGRVG